MTVRTFSIITNVLCPRGTKSISNAARTQQIEKTAATRKTLLFSRTSFRIKFSVLPVGRQRSQGKSSLIPANDSGRAETSPVMPNFN